ncbi:MAG: endonuclease/exonuclease/phosphatase family protein [bacterium]|nr:endonuclease/exonuclease/phosphatase family protein [bacterium]
MMRQCGSCLVAFLLGMPVCRYSMLAILLMTGYGWADAAESPLLRVMSYNIHHAEGMDGQVDVERIAAIIRDASADLVALQEVDRGVERSHRIDIPAKLAELTGMHAAFFKNIDHQGGEYGNAILSRFPIQKAENRHYHMLHSAEQRGLLHAWIDVPGRPLLFLSTHLDFRREDAERLENAKEITKVREANTTLPAILCGDFNDHPNGRLHQAMKTAWLDAWEAAGEGDGFTYSSQDPKSRIDYIYLTQDSGWTVQAIRVIPTEASDHMPLLAEITWQ